MVCGRISTQFTAKEMAKKSSITITELADTLSRDYQISFRKAHSVASYISKQTIKEKKELYEWEINDINEMINEFVNVSLSEEKWKKIISPEYFIRIRTIQGGPNPNEVIRMITERKKQLHAEVQEYESTVGILQEKRANLVGFCFGDIT